MTWPEVANKALDLLKDWGVAIFLLVLLIGWPWRRGQ